MLIGVLKGEKLMNKLRIGIVVVFILIMGIAATVSGITNIIKLNGTVPDFNYDSMASLKKGDFAQGYIMNIFDCYANETTTHTTFGIETSSETSEEYFIMPLINEADEANELYITVTARKKADRNTLYRICDQTWEYWDGNENVVFDEMGVVVKAKKLDDELMQYMTEWFMETEFYGTNPSDIQKHIIPYQLVIYNPNSAYGELAIGVVLLVIFAVIAIVFVRRITNTAPAQTAGGYAAPAPVPESNAPAADNGFSEEYTAPEPVQVCDIPQPVQPDDFFAKPVKKPEPKEEPKPEPAAAPVPVPGDMDALDTSALDMGGLEYFDSAPENGDYDENLDFSNDDYGEIDKDSIALSDEFTM